MSEKTFEDGWQTAAEQAEEALEAATKRCRIARAELVAAIVYRHAMKVSSSETAEDLPPPLPKPKGLKCISKK
eukprot:4022296-Amphidinium_carterae.1